MKNIGFVNWNLKKTLVVFVFVFGTGRPLVSVFKVLTVDTQTTIPVVFLQ